MIINLRKPPFFLLTVYVVYFLYYFADMNTSANTMVKQTESRGNVHVYLAALIGLLAVYFLSHRKWKLNDAFRGSFFAMIVWCGVVDLLVGASFWAIATHVGLLVLFYLIYFFGGNYICSEQRYKVVIILEFSLWVITMWYAITAYFNFRDYYNGTKDIVLNMSYNILVFIPFLLQLKFRPIKIISLGLSAMYIVFSLKRGAIVAMVAIFVVYYYLSHRKTTRKAFTVGHKTMRNLIVIAALMIVAVLVVDQKSGGALSRRFSFEMLRRGSNRDILYTLAWHDIQERNVLRLMIGRGSGSSLQIIGSGVHNEILEFLFSYGAIGLCFYLLFVYKGLKRVNMFHNTNLLDKQVYAMCMTYIIIVGLVGSALFSHTAFHLMLAMGMASGSATQTLAGGTMDV